MKTAVTALLKSIWRAAFALFLLYAAVTPAMAELGSFDEVQAHESEDSAHDVSGGLSFSSPEVDGSAPLGAAQHCCVSHCAHGFVAKPPIGSGPLGTMGRLSYALPQVSDPNSAPRDGPDRPPRI